MLFMPDNWCALMSGKTARPTYVAVTGWYFLRVTLLLRNIGYELGDFQE